MPELSVIVPVYNVEAYLGRCVDSVLAQTFTDWELILIDDGSPDNSGKVCDDYAAKDKRVVVVHKENGGVSSARNLGIQSAKGKYLAFIDPDDWIAPEMFSTMLAEFDKQDVDLVTALWITANDDETESKPIVNRSYETVSQERLLQLFYECPSPVGRNACWKIFRKELVTAGFDEKYAMAEDSKFMFDYAMNCKKAVCLPEYFYYYFTRTGSATNTKKTKYMEAVTVYHELLGRVEAMVKAKTLSGKIFDAAEAHLLDFCLLSMRKRSSADDAEKIRSFYREYVKKHFLQMFCNSALSLKQKIYFAAAIWR